MEEDEDFRCTKTGLRNLLKDPDAVLPILEDAVLRTNEIVTRAWFFLKLYMLQYEGVKVDRNLTELILKVVSKEECSCRTEENIVIMARLQDLYRTTFQPLLPPGDEPPSREGLKQVLKYEALKMLTVFETHLKCHYVSYVNDACGSVYSRRELRAKYKGKKFNPFKWKFNNLLHDVLTVDGSEWKSDPIDHDGVRYLRSLALPPGKTFAMKCLRYDLKAKPQDYFEVLFGLTAMTEVSEERPRLRNLWPLRTSLVPRHLRIDTVVLIELLVPPGERKLYKSVTASKKVLWERFFRTDKKVFKRGDFHYQVETDGVAVSLLFKNKKGKTSKPSKALPTELYIDKLPLSQREKLRDRKVVSIDPGMSDLLSCVSENSTAEDPEKLRYTQNQRRFDLKTTPRKKHLEYMKNTTVVEGRTVEKWETELSDYNHKTADIEKFKTYLTQKLRFNQALRPFYSQYHFRKNRFNTFIDTQKSERTFMKNFKDKFVGKDGSPSDIVIAFGDWSQLHHRKYKEPVKGKGFRTMFRRNGYDVFLVDEHRSSVQCSDCCDESARCYKFRRRLDPNDKKPPSKRHIHKIHGLLVCNTCSRLWNRDINAPLNMNIVARRCLKGWARPSYLEKCKNVATPSASRVLSTIPSTTQGIVKPVKIQIRW